MRAETKSPESERREMLKAMLLRLRDETYQRVKEFRNDQAQESEPAPADEMDFARSSADVETHASLIARAEERMRYIDEALSRIDAGKYGRCIGCHEAIPVERLIALPFAAYCVACQRKKNRAGRTWSEGTMIAPYDQQWTVPEEMQEASEREYRATGQEEDSVIRYGRPSGPEERKVPSARGKRRASPPRKP